MNMQTVLLRHSYSRRSSLGNGSILVESQKVVHAQNAHLTLN